MTVPGTEFLKLRISYVVRAIMVKGESFVIHNKLLTTTVEFMLISYFWKTPR